MPENETAEKSYPIAPVADRLLAFIIDYIPFFLIPAAIIWFILNAMKNTYVPYKTLLNILIAFQILFFVYAAVFNSGGRLTLGKKMMGLKVVNKDGGDINIIRGVLRSAGYFFPIDRDVVAPRHFGFDSKGCEGPDDLSREERKIKRRFNIRNDEAVVDVPKVVVHRAASGVAAY